MRYDSKRKMNFPFFPFFMIAGVLAMGLIVMLLWNAVLSPVLNIATLSYWQAVGLFILSKILFGGFRGGGNFPGKPGWGGGPPWRQKWMNMSEEERAKFRSEWKNRCRSRKTDEE